jgi:hypothetical protein
VNPRQFLVETNLTEGSVTGTRVLTLSPSAVDDTKTEIKAVWKVDLSGIPLSLEGALQKMVLQGQQKRHLVK